MQSTNPVGIFDSGIGGLTVASAIVKLLPNESIIYFGDTAHTPWGSQSQLAITSYATRISEVLMQRNCKAIIIACNSASAVALTAVKQQLQNKVHLLNVIDPVITYLNNNYANKNVGIIGTKQTIQSQAYHQKLQATNSNIRLHSLATPLLAPLIEEGLLNHPATKLIIQHYLSNPVLNNNIQALILGCTHYPLLQDIIHEYFNKQIEVITSANILANYLKKLLSQHHLLNPDPNHKEQLFYVSDDSSFFNQTAKRLFHTPVNLQYFPMWK